MSNIVGIDLGTNSLGINVWDKYGNNILSKQIEFSVDVFQNGVTKGTYSTRESSLAAGRTEHRGKRRLFQSARLRKQATLKHLIKCGYCPLSEESLNRWRFQDAEKGYDRTFPTDEKFMQWLNLNFNGNTDGHADYSSVFQLRAELMERDFDFENSETDRYKLGRALYSMAVHRGFKSNKGNKAGEEDENTESNSAESEDKKSSLLRTLMQEHGFRTIGQAFYYLEKEASFKEGEKGFRIRNSEYTAVRSQYKEEIDAIFERQHLDKTSDFYKGLLSTKKHEGTIFYKKPLRSQKGKIAKCFLEPDKPRCYISHPEFEEFRALQLINNIRIQVSEERGIQGLSDEQRLQLYKDKFVGRVTDYFKFKEIREYLEKTLDITLSKQQGTINYRDETSVSGCPVTARLLKLFDDKNITDVVASGEGKDYTVEDIWHICNTADDEDWLKAFAKEKLNFDDYQTKKLLTLWNNMPDGYSNLSLKAIRLTNPMLRLGMNYADAVMFAKVPVIIGKERFAEVKDSLLDIASTFAEKFGAERDEVRAYNNEVEKYAQDHPDENFGHAVKAFRSMPNKMERFKQFMHQTFTDVRPYMWEKLYHHSDISFYPVPPRDKDGNMYLGSPLKGKIFPPSVKHALCILRKRINDLIKSGAIDPDSTRIVIETAREMCDANMKWAIDTYNHRREEENKEIIKLIREMCDGYKETPITDDEVDEMRLLLEQGENQNDMLEAEGRFFDMKVNAEKYRLWKEQHYLSVYTGKPIPLSRLFTEGYDIDHTLPVSKSFDDSLANKTICEADYNRKVKGNLLPSQLPDHEYITSHSVVLQLWKEKVDRLKKQVELWDKKARHAAEPERKNECMRQKYVYRMELDYWEGKLNRFFVTEIDDRFLNSQLNDTRIITRYANHYLKSVFSKVRVERGETTAKFRNILGIEKKDRSKHYHHAIDALVLSMIPHADLRDKILKTYYQIKEARTSGTKKEIETLNKELRHQLSLAGIYQKEVADAVEKIKSEVIISHEKKDNKMSQSERGDVARGQLHLDTLYGAIILPEQPVQYVTRKPLKSVKSLEEIVDPLVKKAIDYQMKQYGIKNLSTVEDKPMWMMRWTRNADGTETGIIVKEDKNGRPLLPIRHVRIFSTAQINTGNIPIKKTERHSQKALVNLPDRKHKDYQYAVKGDFIACLVYSTMNARNRVQRGYQFITDFELAKAKRENKELASQCTSLQEFILALDKYKYADIPQFSKNIITGYIPMKIERVITPGTILVENSDDKTLSERTFIVRNCNYYRKCGIIWASNHLVADITDTKNLIEIRPSKFGNFEIRQ